MPVHLDIDKNPISEQLGFPFLLDPTDIRWAGKISKLYRVTGMTNIYCDSALFLLDRTQEEVQQWLCDKHGLDCISAESVQETIKNYPVDEIPVLASPIAFSEVNGAASWTLFDIGLEKPLAINAEAYSWLAKEGYSFHYQPGKRKCGVILKRRSEALAGVLMPGDVDLTVRQIYMKALKSNALLDPMSVCTAHQNNHSSRQLIEDESDDDNDVSVKVSGFVTCQNAVSKGFEFIERMYEGHKQHDYKVFTGLSCIDRMLGGINIGDIAVVAGDSVLSFLANIVKNNANKPFAISVNCLRKDIPKLAIQFLCMESHLLMGEINKGMITEKHWHRLANSAGKVSCEYPLYFSDKLPSSIDDMAARIRVLKAEKRNLTLVVLDSLELITGDDKASIVSGLRLLKKLADELSVVIMIGSSSNIRFNRHNRNLFERYADTILILRNNEQNYTSEIIKHDEVDRQYEYDETLRGIIMVNKGTTILVRYPVEVEIRNKDGFQGIASLEYAPQKGVFSDGKMN